MKFDSIEEEEEHRNEREKEVEHRNKKEKEYFEDKFYGIINLSMYRQVLGIQNNYLKEYVRETPREMLRIYKQVIDNDKDGSIVDKESKEDVLKSLGNSINSIGYTHLTKEELYELKSGDKNSFFLTSKKYYKRTDYSDESKGMDLHLIGIVVRKDQNGDFILATINKEEDPQIYIYNIKEDKINDLVESLSNYNSNDGMDYEIKYEFENRLKNISLHDYEAPYDMAEQKTGNCYIKEVEAGLKYALWSRNEEKSKENNKKQNKDEDQVKWPISTLEMHKRFTDENVRKLNKLGYNELAKKIETDFDEYKIRKNEGIRLKRYILKGDERLGSDFIDKLEDEQRLKSKLPAFEKLDDFLKKIKESQDFFNEKKGEYEKCEEKNKEFDMKLDKYKKLNPISKFFKKSKIKHIKAERKQLNNKLGCLKKELKSLESNLKNSKEKYKEFRAKFDEKNSDPSLNIQKLKSELAEIEKFKKEYAYVFKNEVPLLSLNKKISQSVEEAKNENSRKVASPDKDMRIAK